MTVYLALFLVLLGELSSASFPQGWNTPSDTEFYKEWRDRSPDKYLSCRMDFNGDGIVDTAYILESVKGKNFGIFVKLSNYTDQYICLFDAAKDLSDDKVGEDDSVRMQRLYRLYHGIEIAKPGTYKTACGKGYWDCRPDEPEEIQFKYHGIQFFMDEAGFRVLYYWDAEKKKIDEIRIGD